MIAAISIMRRRPDLTREAFNAHWLHPHGTMTSVLPGLRSYVQHHFLDIPLANDAARALAIDGIPELWFDDVAARTLAYASPRIAECNIDSEAFVGAVTRIVAEPVVEIAPTASEPRNAKALVISIGQPDRAWADAFANRVRRLDGLVGLTRHRLIGQAAAPDSRIPELQLPIGGFAQVTFASAAQLEQNASILTAPAGTLPQAALIPVIDHKLI